MNNIVKFLKRVEPDLCRIVAFLTLLQWAFIEMKTYNFMALSVLDVILGLFIVFRAYNLKA